ncbi:MAG: hypothetical protein WHW07_05940 [Bacteroidales bacterium]|nr:hypothetical protein [Bacteroidales bacterium]HOL98101.1 hypothetical protein [Bacteroidales bacterium]HOM36210.1 hypothetical protein [Bacteroidales bacterium]HPD23741.1 hypothetical protein [Bacteroidales bacterium]HRS99781.1 hypothetical protein [Bacteroidales bacterium]
MKHYFTKIFIFSIFLMLIFIFSCHKEERIPYADVDYRIYLDLPEFSDLKTPGNYLKITGGVRGIIIYCYFTDEYRAFERNCPYEPSNPDAVLDVDSTGLFLVCKHCHSKFMLSDGSKIEGPAKYPALQYGTYLENNILYIFNTY